MDSDTTLIILVAFGALGLGLLLTYLFMRAATVRRTLYDKAKDQLAKAQNTLDTKTALEQELRQHLSTLNTELSEEKIKNKDQEKEIAQLQADARNIQSRFSEERETNIKQQESIEFNNNQILGLKSQLAEVSTHNKNLQEKLDKQNTDFEAQRQKSLLEFEKIANKLFDEKSDRFSQTSKEKIEQLLDPLKENINEFKKKVEETYDKESKQRFSLEDKIKELVALNQQISQDATNLTNALKGQAKTQGNWGEMILENILEQSGLVKDREYFTQSAFKDENGRSKQPDVIVKYPDDRYVIIDSKVSLTAYERFANSNDQDEQKIHLSNHMQSIKNHVDNLSSKEYDQFKKGLDFVFLFIPIEPAFLTAIQYDTNLWQYAYRKRIVLMSPTNLIATLKLVQDIWKRELQNRNALEIATRGGQLYDKFVGFIADMEEIGNSLEKTAKKYDAAFGKLSKGSGNLIGQVEKLKKLGAQSKKRISEKYLDDSPQLSEQDS